MSRPNDSDFQHPRNLVPLKDVGFEFEVICAWDPNKEERTPSNASKTESEGYFSKTGNFLFERNGEGTCNLD